MKLFKNLVVPEEDTTKEHDEVGKRLDLHENQLADMAKRLRVLEIEAGIYKPPLRRVGN